MTAAQLRQKYLAFFASKGHAVIPSASVVPENDPTGLFINSGMHPLVPYLMGERHPQGRRLTSVQKCIRTIDIDEVGDATHHTFFEMLGNWSLGDYFKRDAITWSWEFLTDPRWLGLDKNRIAVSVFAGDNDAPFDQEARDIWKEIFRAANLPETRIATLPKEHNWWGPAGETGPCGPDTEIFYWVGDPRRVPRDFDDNDDRWVEIWNNVFMEFHKTASGAFEKLSQKNVDTGMGLVRVLAAMNGVDDNYRTDVFAPIIRAIESLSGVAYDADAARRRAFRIVADHVTAAVIIVADGVEPSNTERGYVVRRLIRRAVRQGHALGMTAPFVADVARVVQELYAAAYPEVTDERVRGVLSKEEEKFRATLESGMREFAKHATVDGVVAFDLYQTYGFPIELTQEMAREKGMVVDEEEFRREMRKHQELSRTAGAGMFKGGLADTRAETTRLHTAAHLMLAGLRVVLGDHVHQKGSNINGERLRFDFSHPTKLTDEQKKAVEDYVNKAIAANVPVQMQEMSVDAARAAGAEGVFDGKYGDVVKVYTIEGFSKEICGGPHVATTADIGGTFAIVKEESSGAGVRRIKAVVR